MTGFVGYAHRARDDLIGTRISSSAWPAPGSGSAKATLFVPTHRFPVQGL